MTLNILREHLGRQPFQPFRVVMSSGQSYDVRHPEMAILLSGGLVVAYGGGNGHLPEGAATLSLLHISSIEELPARRSATRRH